MAERSRWPEARSAGEAYAERSIDGEADDLRVIAARELKRENIGVRRDGYAFVVDAKAISEFQRGYSMVHEELARLHIGLAATFVPRSTDEVTEYENDMRPIRRRAMEDFETRPRSVDRITDTMTRHAYDF